MSSAKQGLRRLGIGGLSLATGASIAMFGFAGAANAAAPDPTLASSGAPNVTQGQNNQAAGDLTYEYNDTYTTNATVTFQIKPGDTANDCSSASGIASAVGFTSKPTVKVTDGSGNTATPPTPTSALASSSGACGTSGVQDELVVTFPSPQDTSPGPFDIQVTGIDYNVGQSAPLGDVDVSATPAGFSNDTAPADVANANVVNKNFMFIPRMSAEPGTTANPLGTATFTETTAGAYFPAAGPNPPSTGCTEVDLALDKDNYTDGVTPTITVPAGYGVYGDPACTLTPGAPKTSGSETTYTFYVKTPSTPVKATVTVAGLEVDAGGGAHTDFVTPTVGGATDSTHYPVLNVVYQDRIGGTDRYETAVKLFNDSEHGYCVSGGFEGEEGYSCAVLSGGQKFPDALSANYLGGELGTATLLTRQNSLPTDVRQALIDDCIGTVYITGETAAVSQAVQDEVSAIPVCGANSPVNSTIRVVRLGGANRYATNMAVNNYVANYVSSADTAVLASGQAPYDSLAVGPLVYRQSYESEGGGLPLVLTDGNALDHGELAQFQNLGTKNIVIVGGTSVVSQAVQDQLTSDGYNVIRVSGATRYATATQIARLATVGLGSNANGSCTGSDNPLLCDFQDSLDSDFVNITDGQGFADALSAGPYAGQGAYGGGNFEYGEIILLAKDPNTVGPDLASYLGDPRMVGESNNGTDTEYLNALGLNDVTSPQMMKDAAADLGPGSYAGGAG